MTNNINTKNSRVAALPSYWLSILLCLYMLVWACQPNYIISVQQSSNNVNTVSTVTVKIKTSTNMSSLDIQVNNAYSTVLTACMLNNSTIACTKIVPSSGTSIRIRYMYSFINGTNYTVTFNCTNPVYADSFLLQAFANISTEFANSASVAILPKTITCTATAVSKVVSQSTNTIFNIGLSTLNTGTLGKILITVNTQAPQFPNIINSSPTCSVDSSSNECALTQVFGQQVLSIPNVNIGNHSLILVINSMRNPPFNSTFENITISIKDVYDRDVQTCTLPQPAPQLLQQSSYLVLQGWSSLVSQSSNTQFLLTPLYAPLSGVTILLVYDKSLTIVPKAPATYNTISYSNSTYMYIQSATYSSQILQFNCTVSNPTSTIPVYIQTYIVYNSTLFRQQKRVPSMLLSSRVTNMSVKLDVATTLMPNTINISIYSPIAINQGVVLHIRVEYGTFVCNNIGIASSLSNTSVTQCNSTYIIIQSTSAIHAQTNIYILVNYITHTSIITNPISMSMYSRLTTYSIMRASAAVDIGASAPPYNITSTNSTYTAISNYTIIQYNSTNINNSIIRYVTIAPPNYVILSQNTTVVSVGANTIVSRYFVDISVNVIQLVVAGRLSIVVSNVRNPNHYLGGREWRISATDTLSYNSSYSTSLHSPQYSPARSSITIQLSNPTIQQLNNITITYQPMLQYSMSAPPTITTELVNTTINGVDSIRCNGCVLLTSTRFKFLYYNVIMKLVLQVVNGQDPPRNTITYQISIPDTVYQIGSILYQLSPVTYLYNMTFDGQYANTGTLEIHILTTINRPLQLTYTGTNAIFTSSQQCIQCNSTYIKVTGIVGYFQSTNVIIQGKYNSTLYARATITVYYTCYTIPGCQICTNSTGALLCERCFGQNFTNNYLLHNGACLSSCPAYTFAGGAVCQSCPQLCYRCTSEVCLQCIPSYYIYNQSCVQQCPPLYIKNATHCLPRPVICPSHCIACPVDNVCNKCDTKYYLLDNLCYSQCPNNYLPNQVQYTCILFIPPQQTKYFPFAFLIASFVVLVILAIIKRFQIRSLILGNFIAVSSLLQIGAIVMMLSYTFISIINQPDRWANNNKLLMQALIFIIILSKVALNAIFVVYFLRKIAHDDNFQNWLSKSEHNVKLYKVLLVLSGVFSFQNMRIIYCRLLGLELFFGRFNTQLIFKPLNFFSLAYIVPGGCLIVMAVFNIIMQNGYRTSILYSSVQVILIQVLVFIVCLIQGCRSKNQYFDYQVYKIQNVQQQNSAAKIDILQHQQTGGSYHQRLISKDGSKNTGPIGHTYSQIGLDSTGKIMRNMRWREKKSNNSNLKEENIVNQAQFQIIEQVKSNQNIINQQNQQEYMLKVQSNIGNNNKKKERSIFRRKIMEDWEKIREKLPKSDFLYKKSKSHSQSKEALPNNKSQVQTLKDQKSPQKLKKIASLQKLQKVGRRISIPSFANKSKLKQHFYSINKGPSNKENELQKNLVQQGIQRVQNQFKNNVNQKQTIELELSDENTGSELNKNMPQPKNNIGLIISNKSKLGKSNQASNQKPDGDLSQIQNNQNQQSFEKSMTQIKKAINIKTNRYDDFDNLIINQDDQQIDSAHINRNETNKSDFNKNGRKIKKRNVNKQTQAVYLQRLVSSSEATRPKAVRRQKLQDF